MVGGTKGKCILGLSGSRSLSIFFHYKGSRRLQKWIASVSLLSGLLAALEMKFSFPLSLHFPPPVSVDLSSIHPLSLSCFKFESTREHGIMLPSSRQLCLGVRLAQPAGWHHQDHRPANPRRAAVPAEALIILVTWLSAYQLLGVTLKHTHEDESRTKNNYGIPWAIS